MSISLKRNAKRYATVFLAVLLSALLVLPANVFAFAKPAFAENSHQDVTNILMNKVFIVKQDGSVVPEGGMIDPAKPLTAEVSFNVPLEGDEPTPENPVRHGDTARFAIGKGIIVSSDASGSRPLVAQIGDKEILIGHVSVYGDESGAFLDVVFDGEPAVFDPSLAEDGNMYHDAWCKANFNFELGANAGGEPGKDYDIAIFDKEHIVDVPDVITEYSMKKSGSVDTDAKRVNWEVELSKTVDGAYVELGNDIFFTDDLSGAGAYKKGTFTLNGEPIAEGANGPSYNELTHELTFAVPDGLQSPVKIGYATELTNGDLSSTGEVVKYNKANFSDKNTNEVFGEADAVVKFTPELNDKEGEASEWIEMNGDPHYKYNPKDRTITWSIVVNQVGTKLNNAKITDVLPPELTFKSSALYKWVDGDWAKVEPWNYAAAEPEGGVYELGSIDSKMKLEIVTAVPDEDWVYGESSFVNNATLTWDGSGEGVTAGDEVGIGFAPIKKSGVLDPKTNTITWTVTVDLKNQDNVPSDLMVYDLLAYGKSGLDLSKTDIANYLPTGMNPSDLRPQYVQQYINGSFKSVSGDVTLASVDRIKSVDQINQNGATVADLLKVTGIKSKEVNVFTFQTRVTDPDVYAKDNASHTIWNTASLHDASGKYLNNATAEVVYATELIDKQMLKRVEVPKKDGIDANNVASGLSDGFDYEENAAMYRLLVNKNGGNISEELEKDGVGSDAVGGKVEVVETLPQGWTFGAIGANEFLVYEADQNGTAVGGPLDPEAIGMQMAVSQSGSGVTLQQVMTFTFDNLKGSYVIVVKGCLTDELAQKYFSVNDSFTDTNTAIFDVKGLYGIEGKDEAATEIKSEVLNKHVAAVESGVLRYLVEYRSYELSALGTHVIDTFPEGIELRTDAQGNLLTDADEIAIWELALQPDGSYVKSEKVPVVTNRQSLDAYNISWDPEQRELEFKFPDPMKSYVLEYTVDITAPSGTNLKNTVSLKKDGAGIIGDSSEYVVESSDEEASIKLGNVLKIMKTDGETGSALAGSVATLFAVDENGNATDTVIRRATTNESGIAWMKNIPVGKYVLQEIAAPQDYFLGPEALRTYQVEVSFDGAAAKYKITIAGQDGPVAPFKNFSSTATVGASVEKRWSGDWENSRSTRPESVTVRLHANGTPVEGTERVLSEENRWSVSWGNLPKYCNETDVPVEYTVVEDEVFNYVPSLELVEGEEGSYDFVLTNTYVGTDVVVEKTWEGDEGIESEVRPGSIKVQLTADGVAVEGAAQTIVPDEKGAWLARFVNLPKYRADGVTPIEYAVVEEKVANYTSSVEAVVDEEDALVSVALTNTYAPEETSTSEGSSDSKESATFAQTNDTSMALAGGVAAVALVAAGGAAAAARARKRS